MIKVFYGEDRVRAKADITKFLGKDYEVYDGPELTPADLPNLFHGNSLLSSSRSIVIRDFFANKSLADQLSNYLDTPHQVVLFELKIDKRSTIYKDLKPKISFVEYNLPVNPNEKLAFDIYRIAKVDGPRAIATLAKIKADEDPMMFFGLITSQALRDFNQKQGIKEKRALSELSKLDLNLKSTSLEPWLLIESFLLRLSSLQ